MTGRSGWSSGVAARASRNGPLQGQALPVLQNGFTVDPLGVAAIEEWDAVGAFLADGAYEAFRVRVAVGAARGDLGHGSALAGEDRVKGGSELGVAVSDEESKLAGAVAELPQQLTGLLGGPGKRRDGQ